MKVAEQRYNDVDPLLRWKEDNDGWEDVSPESPAMWAQRVSLH